MSLAPKVSIGLPVFNGGNFLAPTLESLLNQTFQDFEIVISDNASTDDTPEICQRFASADSRVKYHRSPVNHGAAWNYNEVFRLSRGRYFKWSAHDDLCAPAFLSRCVAVLDSRSDVVLAYTHVRLVDEHGTLLHRLPYPAVAADPYNVARRFRSVLEQTGCYAIFGLIRSHVVAKAPLRGWAAADRNQLARFALLGRFYRIEEDLFFFRSHAGRSVKVHPDMLGQTFWFDPTRRGLILPRLDALADFGAAVMTAPLSLLDRLSCLLQLAVGFRFRGIALDLCVAMRSLLTGRSSRHATLNS
jgi:glycosyltransferase involved in cell wall biosynthesis